MDRDSGELSNGVASDCYRYYGFEPCKFDPDHCERCGEIKPLYFGDRDYWDSREGSYLCGNCLDKRIAADKEFAEYMEQMIDSQRDHESSHMPWMI